MKIRYPQDYQKGIIGPVQSFSIIYQTVIGVGILFMPSTVAASTHRAGIFSILITGFFSWIILSIATWALKRYPQMSIFEAGTQMFGSKKNPKVGKWIFAPIFIAILLNWFGYVVIEISAFVTVLKIEYFTRTPTYALVLLSLILAVYAAKQGAGTIARLNVLLLPVTLIPLVLFFVATLEDGKIINLVPTLPEDWGVFFSGTLKTLFSFAGFMIFFGYVRFYRRPDKSQKAHSWAVWSITIWYAITYLSCISVFGPDEIVNYTTPVLQLVTESHVDQFLLERLDPAFLPTWMIMVFTTAANALFAVSYAIKEFLGLKEEQRGTILFLLSLVIFGLTMLSTNITAFFKATYQFELISWGVFIFVALIFALLAGIRKKGKEEADYDSTSA